MHVHPVHPPWVRPWSLSMSTSFYFFSPVVPVSCSVADSHHIDADTDPACNLDADPDPTFHRDADPDSYPHHSFEIKAQTRDKMLKQAHISYILACHLQFDADPVSAYHFYADRDLDPTFQFDVDPSGSGSTTLISCYFIDMQSV